MTANSKEWIQYSTAALMVVSGVVLSFISFFTKGDVTDGVLWYMAQGLTFAGAIFGVSVYFTGHGLVNLTEGFEDVAVLVDLLIADDRQFVVVLLQHLHGRGQDGGEELAASLHAASVNIGVVLALLSHGGEVEYLHVAVGQSSVGHKDEKVAGTLQMALYLDLCTFLW